MDIDRVVVNEAGFCGTPQPSEFRGELMSRFDRQGKELSTKGRSLSNPSEQLAWYRAFPVRHDRTCGTRTGPCSVVLGRQEVRVRQKNCVAKPPLSRSDSKGKDE